MTRIKFHPDYIPLILEGRKTATLRDREKCSPGDAVTLTDPDGVPFATATVVAIEPIYLTNERFTTINHLRRTAVSCGFSPCTAMLEAVRGIYPPETILGAMYVHHFDNITPVEPAE